MTYVPQVGDRARLTADVTIITTTATGYSIELDSGTSWFIRSDAAATLTQLPQPEPAWSKGYTVTDPNGVGYAWQAAGQWLRVSDGVVVADQLVTRPLTVVGSPVGAG